MTCKLTWHTTILIKSTLVWCRAIMLCHFYCFTVNNFSMCRYMHLFLPSYCFSHIGHLLLWQVAYAIYHRFPTKKQIQKYCVPCNIYYTKFCDNIFFLFISRIVMIKAKCILMDLFT